MLPCRSNLARRLAAGLLYAYKLLYFPDTLAYPPGGLYNDAMKKILFIGTGGTVASSSTTDGLAPSIQAEELLRDLLGPAKACEITPMQVLNLDSTDMTPADWLLIARTIEVHYDAYDGFVIAHGTDTMAYTAAALSYLIRRSPKPIVLTGAQKPIHSDNTDSRVNLQDAFAYACAPGSCGVVIVFNGAVILGTRARKVRSKSFSAFSSINFPELASVREGRVLRFIDLGYKEPPVFCHKLEERVSLVKLIPGMDADLLAYALEHNRALVVESFGVGGVPGRHSRFYEVIAAAVEAGKTVVMTTQVPNEGSDLTVYRVGHELKKHLPILEAYDMTTEAVVAKLMWILGQTREHGRITELFYKPVSKDILYTEEIYGPQA